MSRLNPDLKGYSLQFKQTFLLAYPVMLSQFGQVMVGVVDSMMVGHLGTEPLAAASLANSVFVMFLTFGLGISMGITPVVAHADGEGKKKQIIEILKHGVLNNSLVGVLLFLLLLVTSGTFTYLSQPPEVVALAIPYFQIISFSLIPFMIFQAFRQFLEGLGLTRQAMYITITGNIINIALNYILIFGKFGMPAMGLEGAGWATFIARSIMAILMVFFTFISPVLKKYREYYTGGRINYMIIRKLMSIGVPIGFQFVFEVGAFTISAIMIGWIGATALAAHQIAISLASITFMMATGIGSATTIRVGNQNGRKDFITLRKVGFTSYIMIIIFMSINGLLMILGRDFFPTLYINEPDVITLASGLLIVAALFQVSDGMQVVGLGACRGMMDVKIPTLYTLIAYWIIGLPVGYVLGFHLNMGAKGIWWGLLIGLSVTAVLMLARFNRLSLTKLRFSDA